MFDPRPQRAEVAQPNESSGESGRQRIGEADAAASPGVGANGQNFCEEVEPEGRRVSVGATRVTHRSDTIEIIPEVLMRLVRFALAILLFPLPAVAQECPELVALRALYGIRELMMGPYASSYEIGNWIDQQLNELRDPLPTGGYRWVRFVRPSGDAPVVKREHLISSDFASGERDTFEAEADHPFAVRVAVPRKRTLLKGNKEAYIGTVRIRYVKDGQEKVMEKRINEWLAPDTSRSFDLGLIADRADVAAETATRSGSLKDSLVEIHFRQAVAQDDSENPNYETVAALKRIRTSPDPVTLDLEIARLERRLFPGIDVIPFTTMGVRLREAEKLMVSEKEEEREKGRKMLAEVVRSLPR